MIPPHQSCTAILETAVYDVLGTRPFLQSRAEDKILDGRTKKQLVMEKYIMYTPKRSMRKNKPV